MSAMRRNVYLGIMPAPYRVDLCNYLYEHFNCEIYHQPGHFDDACFDIDAVEGLCRFGLKRTRSFSWMGRSAISLPWLRNLLKEYDPEYVFVSEFSLTALSVILMRFLMRRHFKVVSVCDDNMDMIGGNDISRYHRLARRFVPKWLDNLLLVNDETVQWYRSHFGKGVCFPIIADEQRLRKEMEAALPRAAEWVEKLGLQGRKVVLYIGRLIDVKNIDRLLAAFPLVDPPASLVLVGDGVCRTELEDQCRRLKLENVHFIGKQTGQDLYAWYDIADVLVLPSTREAFGAVVNEALVGGCPVAVSRHAGASALVQDAGSGVVFDPCSTEEIARSLNTVLHRSGKGEALTLRDNLMPVNFLPSLESALSQLK